MSDTTFKVDRDNLEVHASRSYATTKARLFEACSTADQIKQWWGPAKYETVVEEHDFRVGGKWRYVHTSDDERYVFNGEFTEIDEPNKIVMTFEYQGMPGHILLETITFEEQADGRVLMTDTAKYENLEDLEGMVNSGMESGQRESLERLVGLIEA